MIFLLRAVSQPMKRPWILQPFYLPMCAIGHKRKQIWSSHAPWFKRRSLVVGCINSTEVWKKHKQHSLQAKMLTPHFGPLWTLRRRKGARRCGAKHAWKSKCEKHTTLRTTLHHTTLQLLQLQLQLPLPLQSFHTALRYHYAHYNALRYHYAPLQRTTH